MLTAVGNFISNSFYKDQFGAGLEYALKVKNAEMFMLRAGYRFEQGITSDVDRTSANTGIAAGVSFQYPLSEDSNTLIALNYSYRTAAQYSGSHAFGLRLSL